MKKLLSLVILLLATVAPGAMAADHALFMGIPMNGSLSAFCNKLVSQKGLRIVERDNDRGVYTLSGRFMGYNDCEFYVFDNDNTDMVFQIDVYLPKCTTWNSIKNQYNKAVREYRANSSYTFDESEAEFTSPYRDGDGDEVAAVKAEKVNYHTDFTMAHGLLIISISEYMQTRLRFFDVPNYPLDSGGSSGGGSGSGGIGGAGGIGGSDSGGSGGIGGSGSGGGGGTTVTPPAGSSMLFMGIPMRGNINSFAQQLVNQKGCRIVSNNPESNSISMRGTYTGKNCEIYVFGTPGTKQVWKVTVYLPEQNTWTSLKREYLNYKSEFDKKYTLTSSYDFFADPYNEGDGREVEAIKDDKCHYSSFYDAAGGNIMVKVSKYMQVQISYEDSTNSNLYDREAEGGSGSGGGSTGGFGDI